MANSLHSISHAYMFIQVGTSRLNSTLNLREGIQHGQNQYNER